MSAQLQLVGMPMLEAPAEECTFDDFWTLYPRRVAKKEATLAWNQTRHDDRMRALVALLTWRRVWAMRGDTQFIPHPASWLRGERYDDEIPPEFLSTGSAAHVAAVIPVSNEREAMPESVRLMIAKLRKGK
jgi:hypothetical protein